MKLSYDFLKKAENIIYDEKEVLKSILIIRKSTKQSIVVKTKLKLFEMVSVMTCKNIDNYFFLVRNNKTVLFTRDDLVADCYIMFERCVTNFLAKKDNRGEFVYVNKVLQYDYQRKGSFMFYYNKALTMHILRMVGKETKHLINNITIEDYSYFKDSSKNDIESVNMHIKLADLSKDEEIVLRSRLNNETQKDFFKKYKHCFTQAKYYKVVQDLQQKFKREDLL